MEKEINEEINKAEKEIETLKNNSPEKIRKIAIETSSDLVKQLIGVDVNQSSISAIVEDISKKEKLIMTIDATFWVAISFFFFLVY